jgi:hypothetical protein
MLLMQVSAPKIKKNKRGSNDDEQTHHSRDKCARSIGAIKAPCSDSSWNDSFSASQHARSAVKTCLSTWETTERRQLALSSAELHHTASRLRSASEQ